MANLTGNTQVFANGTTIVDSAATMPIGTHAFDTNGNEYIYLSGIGAAAAGNWVTYNPITGVTALLAHNAIGPVAIAMAATVVNTYGWYMIRGTYATASSDTVAGAAPLYIDGTSGRVDDAGVSGDCVFGAWATAADAANKLPVNIIYPYVLKGAYLV